MKSELPQPIGAVVRPLADGVSFDFPGKGERWVVERDEDALHIESADIPRERLTWVGWAMILAAVLAIAGIATIHTMGSWLMIPAIALGGGLAIYAHLAGRKHVNVRLTHEAIVGTSGGLEGVIVGARPSSVGFDAEAGELIFEGEQPQRLRVQPEIGEWVAARCNDHLAGRLEFAETDATLPGRIEAFSPRDGRLLRVALWGTWFAGAASNAISIVHSGFRNDFSGLYIAGDLAFRGVFLSLLGAFAIWMIAKSIMNRTRFDDVRHLASRMKHGWVASVLAALAAGAVFMNLPAMETVIDIVWNVQWFVLFGWIALVGLVVTTIGQRRSRELREIEQQVTFDFTSQGAREVQAEEQVTPASSVDARAHEG